MNEDIHSQAVEAPNCFGEELDEGSQHCKDCLWLKECEEDVYLQWAKKETRQRIKVRGHYRMIERDFAGRFIRVVKWRRPSKKLLLYNPERCDK